MPATSSTSPVSASPTSAGLMSSQLYGRVARHSAVTARSGLEEIRIHPSRAVEMAMKKQAIVNRAMTNAAEPSRQLISKAAALTITKVGHFDAQVFLDTVGAGRVVSQYKTGEDVFLQGDPADAVFYIQKGKVQITIISQQGKEGVIAVLGAGEFFGEGCLAGQPLHIATATATVESAIVKVEKQTMVRVLRDQPALSQMFMTFLLSRNIQVEADLVDHLFNSSEKRLARILLLLANFGKDGNTKTIPKISQESLASRVGTTRARINFFMNKFRKLGFIEYTNGPLKIHPSLLNVIVHD